MSALEDLALIQSDYRRAKLAGLPIDTAALFDALDRLDLSAFKIDSEDDDEDDEDFNDDDDDWDDDDELEDADSDDE